MAKINWFLTLGHLSAGKKHVLDGDEFHHLKRVLRLREDDTLVLFDGKGTAVRGKIERMFDERCMINLDDEPLPTAESDVDITLAQAIPKKQAMETVVEKATELGARAVIPVMCEHSEAFLDSWLLKQRERWRKIAVSAAKQCERAFVPKILPEITLLDFLVTGNPKDSDHTKILLLPNRVEFHEVLNNFPLLSAGKTLEKTPRVTLLVGPEGGFSDKEARNAVAAGYRTLSLGPRVMRTETAGIAALTVIQWVWGDFQ